MPLNTKILLLVLLLLIAAWSYRKYQKSRPAKIHILQANTETKEVQFEMSYQGMQYASAIKLGDIKRKITLGHTFEVLSQAKALVFAIKDPFGNSLATKRLEFHG